MPQNELDKIEKTFDIKNGNFFKDKNSLSLKMLKQTQNHSIKRHAVVIIYIVLFVIVGIIFSSVYTDQLKDLKTGAWTLFASIVGAAIYHVFGAAINKSND